MAERYFLRHQALTGFEQTQTPDGPALEGYDRFRAMVQAISPSLASLFAEPVLARGASPAESSVSWYTPIAGEAQSLASLDPIQRGRAVEALRASLTALEPALLAAASGPHIAPRLYVPSLDDVFVVGGQPVLTNWGLAPAGVLGTEGGREAHFQSTLGQFTPAWPAPPASSPDHAAWAALFGGAQSGATATQPSGGPLPAAAAAIGPAASGVATPAAGAAAEDRPPWWRRGPAIAAALALTTLIILLIPGVRVFANRDGGQIGAIDSQVEALRDRAKQLESALNANQCPADPAALRGLLPADPDATQVPKPGQTDPKQTTSLADLIDASVVVVLAQDGQKVGSGTGFFVNGDTIVTNRHVLLDGKATKVMVASRALGGMREVQVGANGGANLDLAILKVSGAPAQAFLPLADGSVARLDQVIAGGYPGLIVDSDPQWQAMLKGDAPDAASLPQPVLTQGHVSQVQGPQGAAERVVHDAPISPGNSGGPLVDSCGRAVGINTFIRGNAQMATVASFALHRDKIVGFLEANQVSFTRASEGCGPGATQGAAPPQAPPPSGPAPATPAPTPPKTK